MPRTVIHLALIGLTLGLLASPQLAFAQTATDTTGDQTTTPTPTPTPTPTTPTPTPVPTTGGTGQGIHPTVPLHATPGAWTAAGLSAAVTRQNDILHGSATPTAETPSVLTTFLVSFLGNLFDNFNKFLVAVLANSTLGNGLPGGVTVPTITSNGREWGGDQLTYQVIVFFVDKVDKTTAETASNYSIGNIQASTAVLDADRTVVTVGFQDATFPANSDLTVALQNIKNDFGDTGQSSTGHILTNVDDDKKIPTAEVKTLADNQVTVTFSEVMDKESVEKQANYLDVTNSKPPTFAKLSNLSTSDILTVTLTFADTIVGHTLRVSVGGTIKDLNDKAVVETNTVVPQLPANP